jgi:hypothetical protein
MTEFQLRGENDGKWCYILLHNQTIIERSQPLTPWQLKTEFQTIKSMENNKRYIMPNIQIYKVKNIHFFVKHSKFGLLKLNMGCIQILVQEIQTLFPKNPRIQPTQASMVRVLKQIVTSQNADSC